MFCSGCGKEIGESSNFCPTCGARQSGKTAHKHLTRSATDSKIAGVCGGIAEYLDIDATVVRLVWIVLSIVPGGVVGGVVAYLLAWIIIPKAQGLATATGSASVPGTPASR
jgi:phage shock protein C